MKISRATQPDPTETAIPAIEAVQQDLRLEEHQARVAEAAYYLAEKRGFAPGFEMQDWLAAEALLVAEPRCD